MNPPSIVIVAGPNGAGKSTAAPRLLRGVLRVPEYVNADVIAQGLSAFDVEGQALAAGRIMRSHLRKRARERASFAFETTLATRSYASWVTDLRASGYLVHLVFLWLPSAEMARRRVGHRVRHGGHDIPEETVIRRYELGLQNFFRLYRDRVDSWLLHDSSALNLDLIAQGGDGKETKVAREATWYMLLAEHLR